MSEAIFTHKDEGGPSEDHREPWELVVYRTASTELRSRHSLVWQARVAYFLTIAGFFVLAQTDFFQRTRIPSSIFILAFTIFMLVIDNKYQKIKQDLYELLENVEKDHKIQVYKNIKEVDTSRYPRMLYTLMIIIAILWTTIIWLL